MFKGHKQFIPTPTHTKGLSSGDVKFNIFYWTEELDFQRRREKPWICSHDAIADTWRGRWDNAHATLRACGAEGSGFKPCVQHFSILSSRGTAIFDLKAFYAWSKEAKKKVLTERLVLGSIIESYQKHPAYTNAGVTTHNRQGGWQEDFCRIANESRAEAEKEGGVMATVILTEKGDDLSVFSLMKLGGVDKFLTQRGQIKRILLVVGGPHGIPPHIEKAIAGKCQGHVAHPVLMCSLPGGKMHSCYAVSSIFTLHDQKLLMPLLEHRILKSEF